MEVNELIEKLKKSKNKEDVVLIYDGTERYPIDMVDDGIDYELHLNIQLGDEDKKEFDENYEYRNEEITRVLRNGLFSWENENTISIDGTNITLEVKEE